MAAGARPRHRFLVLEGSMGKHYGSVCNPRIGLGRLKTLRHLLLAAVTGTVLVRGTLTGTFLLQPQWTQMSGLCRPQSSVA